MTSKLGEDKKRNDKNSKEGMKRQEKKQETDSKKRKRKIGC